MADNAVKSLFDGILGGCNPYWLFLILILLVAACCGIGCGR